MKTFLLFSILACTSILSAETKVSIYSVPFGMVGEVNSENFRAFEKRVSSLPAQSFVLNERDMVISGDGITISLDNKNDSIGNYNRLLAALYSYAKNTPGIDVLAVKQAVAVLSADRSQQEER